MSSIAKFKLEDCNGKEFEYEVTRFTVDEQAKLQLILGEPLFEAVSQALATLAPIMQKGEAGKIFETNNLSDMGKALSGANWTQAAKILSPIPKMILEKGGPALIEQVFSKTIRKVPIEAAQSQTMPVINEDSAPKKDLELDLGNPGHRDQAYGNGNMGEYWKAAAMVLVANFTQSGQSGYVTWKDGIKALTGGMLIL